MTAINAAKERDGPTLSVESLSIESATGKTLVEGLTFDVPAKSIIALVGPSGAGKTLTALAVSGLLRALNGPRICGGSILVEGRNIAHLGEAELTAIRGKTIGVAFQEPGVSLNPYRTIGSQLEDPFRFHGITNRSCIREAIRSALAAAQIEDAGRILKSFPRELSGGEIQRSLIALALVLSPRLLILDEPTTALDTITKAEILGLISSLRENGTAILMISHELGAVNRLADRVVAIENGRAAEPTTVFPTKEARSSSVDTKYILTPVDGPLLEVRDLSKRYYVGSGLFVPRSNAGIERVSFRLDRGERIAIVGATASGKTTLARCMAGLERPSSGIVRWGTSKISGLRPTRPVQLVFQEYGRSLDPTATIRASLREAAACQTSEISKQDALVAMIADSTSLSPDLLRRHPHELSGGQRQRVAIARCLLGDPMLLIADEPVTALDENLQRDILDLLLEHQTRRGFALAIISHDLDVVAQVCDRVLVMYQGQLVEDANFTDLMRAPRHPHSQQLIAAYHALKGENP